MKGPETDQGTNQADATPPIGDESVQGQTQTEERLVEVAPQRHTRVALLVPQDAFPVLASVHALAAELAVPRIGREHVERMRKLNREFARALSEGRAEAAYSADDDLTPSS